MLYAIATLGIIGVLAAVILYFVSVKFKVKEDPKIEMIEEVLPGANCGGCGYAGCHALAVAIAKSGTCKGKLCTSQESNKKVAEIMGEAVEEVVPKKAILCCNGSCENAPAKYHYDSAMTCAYANMLVAGESGCAFGCLGLGDCVRACTSNGIKIDEKTKLPVINKDLCIACGSCVRACPRHIIEIRTLLENNIIFVACKNQEKGGDAKKNCSAACIGCKKCEKVCEYGAISVENNVAHIDDEKCTGCGKCEEVCPTHAIHKMMFLQ